MSERKALGGIAPFGYRWKSGELVVDKDEAPVRKLIFELFLKHRRKKTVAKLLNDLGHRTRSSSLFSDTTIDRLLRDTTAKGIREVDGQIVEVEPIISSEIWEHVNSLLGNSGSSKQAIHLFTGKAYCSCGGKMVVPSNNPKYVCIDCRRKILIVDLEAIFCSQLKHFPGSEFQEVYEHWQYFHQKEKRILIEQICERIVIERDTITIRFGFGYSPHPLKAVADEQQIEKGNETVENASSEPVLVGTEEDPLSPVEAAKALGISETTLYRRRKAGQIGFYKDGSRVSFSRARHLVPYQARREEKTKP